MHSAMRSGLIGNSTDAASGDNIMLDIDAPIIAGREAAGITLNFKMEDVLHDFLGLFQVKPAISWDGQDIGTLEMESPNVSLFTNKENLVIKIFVYGEYRGIFRDKITIGSTL